MQFFRQESPSLAAPNIPLYESLDSVDDEWCCDMVISTAQPPLFWKLSGGGGNVHKYNITAAPAKYWIFRNASSSAAWIPIVSLSQLR